jgi:hypothetical protein
MSFIKRLQYYFIGILMGSIMVYHLFKTRFPSWLPGTVVKENLQKHPLQVSPRGGCELKCLDLSEEKIRELLINGNVNFGESQVHNSPCPIYAVEESGHPDGKLRVFFEQCDSVTIITSAFYTNRNHGCDCD